MALFLESFAIQLKKLRLGSIDNTVFFSYHLLDIYNMPDMVLNTLQGLFHLILIITL